VLPAREKERAVSPFSARRLTLLRSIGEEDLNRKLRELSLWFFSRAPFRLFPPISAKSSPNFKRLNPFHILQPRLRGELKGIIRGKGIIFRKR
jgi:hypothetical protein